VLRLAEVCAITGMSVPAHQTAQLLGRLVSIFMTADRRYPGSTKGLAG
jgi:hypothetical protein